MAERSITFELPGHILDKCPIHCSLCEYTVFTVLHIDEHQAINQMSIRAVLIESNHGNVIIDVVRAQNCSCRVIHLTEPGNVFHFAIIQGQDNIRLDECIDEISMRLGVSFHSVHTILITLLFSFSRNEFNCDCILQSRPISKWWGIAPKNPFKRRRIRLKSIRRHL